MLIATSKRTLLLLKGNATFGHFVSSVKKGVICPAILLAHQIHYDMIRSKNTSFSCLYEFDNSWQVYNNHSTYMTEVGKFCWMN